MTAPPIRRLILSLAAAALPLTSCAQPVPATAPVDAVTRQQVVDGTLQALADRYVFPDAAQRAISLIRAEAAAGGFAGLDDSAAFADRLTALLQRATQDRHLRVRYSARPLPTGDEAAPDAAERAHQRRQAAQANFGVERVERLPGNLGYIDLRSFHDLAEAAPSLSAAMNLVAHTDALIVDLRRNGGGDPAAVAFLTSYLLDERTHLNSLWWREGERTEQFWTQDVVPGPRFGGRKPVYVLTARHTFSGAEEFSYNLKALKRATLVGETTGGGAHPGGVVRVAAHFGVFVPTGRAINPITKSNWEGTGVEPDVPVPADDALRVAQGLALAPLIAAETEPARRQALQRRLAELDKPAAAAV
jgi:C-terminal processing protease CtpA/Prc